MNNKTLAKLDILRGLNKIKQMLDILTWNIYFLLIDYLLQLYFTGSDFPACVLLLLMSLFSFRFIFPDSCCPSWLSSGVCVTLGLQK